MAYSMPYMQSTYRTNKRKQAYLLNWAWEIRTFGMTSMFLAYKWNRFNLKTVSLVHRNETRNKQAIISSRPISIGDFKFHLIPDSFELHVRLTDDKAIVGMPISLSDLTQVQYQQPSQMSQTRGFHLHRVVTLTIAKQWELPSTFQGGAHTKAIIYF